MRTKIITDSTADLPRDILLRYDVGVTPLYIIKDGVEYRDGVTITPADIFRHVEEGGALCTTAAVSEYDYRQAFSQYAHRYDAVIQITIGSGFSACYRNACEASQGFENVFVVNSENLSTGQGHVVLAAARMAEKGVPAPEIVSALNALVPRVEASFLLDRLDYMKKGGRCSAVTALGANMLHIKPCIEVKGGKMTVVKKYRGSFAKCISHYVKDRLDGREDIQRDTVFITHPAATEEAVEAARQAVNAYGSFTEVWESHAGCTVSCHCGPNTLGVLFVRK